MNKVVVWTEVNTYQVRGPEDDYLNGVPYSYRGETGGEVTNVVAQIENSDRGYFGDGCGKELDVDKGDTVYAVVVEYSTGDTFGQDGGQSQVLDVFTDPEEAAALADVAINHDSNKNGFGFDHNGVHYSTPWCGYFETLNNIDVWDIQVRGKDPVTSEKADWGFRRGH